MTKNEEVELLWRAREVLSHPDPERRALAWDAIYKLADFAKDPAVVANAKHLIVERPSAAPPQAGWSVGFFDVVWKLPSGPVNESRIWNDSWLVEAWLGRVASR